MTNETQAWASRYFGAHPDKLTTEQLEFAERALQMGLDFTIDLPREPVNLPQPVYLNNDFEGVCYMVPLSMKDDLDSAILNESTLGEDWAKYRTKDGDYPYEGLYAIINQ